MISICIPTRNDHGALTETIDHLFLTATGEMEIVICNDGSVNPDGSSKRLEIDRPGVKVINTVVARGVGYSFDRAVSQCSAETIILMGCEVLPKYGWYESILDAVKDNPQSIGCAVCIGLQKNNHDLYNPKNRLMYGADLLVTVGIDDLPEYKREKMRQEMPGYTDLFKGKWCSGKKSDEPYEISSLMGAMYFTSRSWYNHIGGFDTTVGDRYRGHRVWGSLESYLSIKSWLCGGNLLLHPDIQAGHEFSREDKLHRYRKGARSTRDMWWNKCFINETMVLDPVLREKIYNYVTPELNYNYARNDIKKNYSLVEQVREDNKGRFTRDLQWLMDRFGYEMRTK